jgi:hypothetical protein
MCEMREVFDSGTLVVVEITGIIDGRGSQRVPAKLRKSLR